MTSPTPSPTPPPGQRPWSVVLLAEHALTEHDVARVAGLHDPDPVRVHVLVPVDTRHNPLVEALDEAALGRLRDAVTDSGDPPVTQAEDRARAALDASVVALREVGLAAEGGLVGDDPVADAAAAVRAVDADEVLVITEPHLLESAFRRDWASRLRHEIDRPVLHVVSGTDRVVS